MARPARRRSKAHHLRSPHDIDAIETAGRKHSDFTCAHTRTMPQQGLAAGNVRTRVGNKLS